MGGKAAFTVVVAGLFHFASALAQKTITRDVCIIGGGSSGTYTAVQLHKHDHSVALIEQLGQLGGNVNTYRDPKSGQTLDIGVVVYENTSTVNDYLGYLNIATVPLPSGESPTTYANFKTGSEVNIKKVTKGNLTAAFEAYQEQLEKYPFLVNGYNLPSPIPADLLLTWGEFIKKHKLEALAYITSLSLQGVKNYPDTLALHMMKYFNLETIKSFIEGYIMTKVGDNQKIYDTAASKLGHDVFLNSTVVSVKRTANGVETVINSPEGRTTIHSKQLVVAIRPTLSAVQPWLDVSSEEKGLFSQFVNSNYFCSLIGNTGIPKNESVTNVDLSQPFGIPAPPSTYTFGATDLEQGFHTLYYTSPDDPSTEAAQSNVTAALSTLVKGLGYKDPKGPPKFIFWHAHTPFFLTVPKSAVKNGFYTRLEALQSEKRTFYTGAAWQTEDSSAIWNFTQAKVLPRLLKALQN